MIVRNVKDVIGTDQEVKTDTWLSRRVLLKKDGKKYALGPGVVYALDEHDEHWLRGGKEPLRVICVFNPPLTGLEVHDAKGVYPLETTAA
jgi:L-ectoine synthase